MIPAREDTVGIGKRQLSAFDRSRQGSSLFQRQIVHGQMADPEIKQATRRFGEALRSGSAPKSPP